MRIPRLRPELFTTRVARRILGLLAVVAVVPLLLLAGLSLEAVSSQLEEHSRDRMRQVTKAAGMALAERLQLLGGRLQVAASRRGAVARDGEASPPTPDGFTRLLPADGAPGPPPGPEERAHLERGEPLLRIAPDGSLLLGVLEGDAVVWGLVDPGFLWPTAQGYADISTLTLFCVLAADGRPLYCDSPVGEAMAAAFAARNRDGTRGWFEWESRGRDYLGAHWELFLRPSHMADPWTVVVSEDRALALSAMDTFRLTLPPALLAALTTVLLLANVQVRRTTEPLEKLQEGTRRVAERRFDTAVDIRSGDEFEEVGDAFNAMVLRLDVQFRQLEAAREIDRAVLSSTEPDEVVRALLGHFAGVVACDRLGVVILNGEGGAVLHTEAAGAALRPRELELDADVLTELGRGGHGVIGGATAEMPSGLRLPDGPSGDGSSSLVLPMMVQRELQGAVIAERGEPFGPEEIDRARQIADQTGVALAGAWLVSDLEEMSWGTLRALAGAIDASSPWTGGHSERVARLAVALGRRLGLPEREIEVLEQGALLHDVGKIGIPGEIREAGRLDEEDREALRRHVEIGVRILEPIRSFRPVLPLVRQHHERWDGKGYPDGRAGTGIQRLARVLAVADAYDNLTSPRPYRGPMSREAVLAYVEREAGREFDPEVVAALAGLMREDGDDDLEKAEVAPRDVTHRETEEVADATA